MDANLNIIELAGGLYKVTPQAGYRLYNTITQRFHSEAIVENVEPFIAVLDGTPPQPTDRTLAIAKAEKIAALKAYDASPAVNSFSLGGQSMWIAPDDRANYILTLQGAKRLGVETVSFLGQDIPVDNALAMLDAVNLYAMQCVGVTAAHEAAINAKRSISTVDAYDFTTGYPEKPNF